MDQVKRYCKRCSEITYHDVYNEGIDNNPQGNLERVFFAVTTLGFSEMMSDKIARCCDCGKKVVVG